MGMILTSLTLLLADPCGVDRVTAVRDGVAISFKYRQPTRGYGFPVILHSGTKQRHVRIGPRPITMRLGDILELQGRHGVCHVTLKVSEGRLGIESDYQTLFPEERESKFTPI